MKFDWGGELVALKIPGHVGDPQSDHRGDLVFGELSCGAEPVNAVDGPREFVPEIRVVILEQDDSR